MKRLALLLCALCCATAAAQRPVAQPQTSQPPLGSRFQVLQSAAAPGWVLRLDRFTGQLSQLVSGPGEEPAWKRVYVTAFPAARARPRPRFQLFESSSSPESTLLLDTETGDAWAARQEVSTVFGGESYPVVVFEPVGLRNETTW